MLATSVAAAVALGLGLSACSSNDSGSGGDNTAAAPEWNNTGNGDLRVWLVGNTDTPQAAVDYLVKQYKTETGHDLKVERQSWTGLVDKYSTVLTGNDAPDIVEIGNTQSAAFTSAGAFLDLTSKKAELGGDDLLPGFVEAGTYDGKFYAAPYYSGARAIFYSKEILDKAGATVPKTFDEYVATGKAMTTDTVSGIWAPGKDWYNAMPYVWVNGGEIATKDGDQWKAGFESEGAIAGLKQLQDVYQNATHARPDQDETDPQIPFCEGKVGFLSAPTWVRWSLAAKEDDKVPGCVSTYASEKNLHSFALPGKEEGTFAPVFAGGSNIAIPSKSKNQDNAYKAMQIMLSDGYQEILAKAGLVPAKVSQAKFLPTDEFSQAAANAAKGAKLTPASPNWADVEASNILQDSFSKIASGADVTQVAKDLDAKINEILNKN